MRTKLAGSLLVLVLAAGLWFARDQLRLPGLFGLQAPPKVSGFPSARVVLMPTNGGQLEIATVTAQEALERESSGKYRVLGGLFEVDLGTTYSRVRVTAVYRYHLKMASVWKLELRSDRTCVVRTSQVEPTLPVAFDTATLERFTTSGWARFDKHENLADLERSLTAALAGMSRRHLASAMEVGRPVLQKWVADWLLKYERDGGSYKVLIVYPGEEIPAPATAQ